MSEANNNGTQTGQSGEKDESGNADKNFKDSASAAAILVSNLSNNSNVTIAEGAKIAADRNVDINAEVKMESRASKLVKAWEKEYERIDNYITKLKQSEEDKADIDELKKQF